MSVSDRIHAQSNAAREGSERAQQQRQREQAAQRVSRDVAAGDAETHAQRAARADERSADAVTLDDAEQDRDGGTRSMTLQDRLEMEANKLRARNEDRQRPDAPTRNNDGRTR